MERKITQNERVKEEYIEVSHPSGLTILMYPMKGYSSATAFFATRYGSIDTCFKTKNDTDFVTVPEGIAHFLEHKLFENEDSPVFEQFGKTGAYCNAATSFDRTFYYFRSSDQFEENLRILLNFVQSPYFTQESVDKEQGIIGQEIRMYDDEPNWRVFFNLLTACYRNHPVRIDIAGTVESIAQIDADLLYRCYHTFYNLGNMVLCVAGNFDPECVLSCCDQYLKPNEDIELEAKTAEEPYEIVQAQTVQQFAVSMPLFHIGFKGVPKTGLDELKASMAHEIMLELMVGAASPLYRALYEEGLINASFGTEVFTVRGGFLSIIAGESRSPREVLARVKAEFTRAKAQGLDEREFEIVRKDVYGQAVRSLASIESVAQNLMDAKFSGVGFFDNINVAAQLTFADITRCLAEFDIDNCALSIVEPNKA